MKSLLPAFPPRKALPLMHTSRSKPVFRALAIAAGLSSSAELAAQVFTRSPGVVIPDNDASGVSDALTVSLPYEVLGSISVGLRITSAPDEVAWNGDLYAYLYHDGALTVLLNRPGRTATNPDGESHPGIDVTFSTRITLGDIHTYGENPLSPATSASVALTGHWSPDGRSASPNLVTDTSPRDAGFSVVENANPNGVWVLFVADRAGGSVGQLEHWSLEFSPLATVPEPRGMLLFTLVATLASAGLRRGATRREL